MLAFIDEVRAMRERLGGAGDEPAWPVITHCSAGVGRTGVMVLVELVLAKVESGEVPDIKGVLTQLREQRVSMVQTLDQYRFCYETVLYALRHPTTDSYL